MNDLVEHSISDPAETPRSILVVDDEPMVLQSLDALLSHHGYQVITAQSGSEALNLLEASVSDVLLLDLRMPGMTGFELMDAINERNLPITTIVVSGGELTASLTGAMERGAYDYVKKPYSTVELLTTVRNAFRKRQFARLNEQLGQRLRASEHLYRFLVKNSPEIIFVLDDQNRVKFVNDRIREGLGHVPDQLVGKSITTIVEDEDSDRLVQFLASAAAATEDAAKHGEFCLRTSEHSLNRRYFEISVFATENLQAVGSPDGEYLIHGSARETTDRKLAEEMMSFHSFHDPLTRLPSRSLFRDRLTNALGRAARQSLPLHVIFIDLDGFKAVNDTLGHAAGDQLLKGISKRVVRVIRSTDTLARMGGDEFALLLADAGDTEAALQVARKVLAEIMEPLNLEGQEVRVGASIGIAAYPEHGSDVETLMRHADMAMYHVKSHGKNNVRAFSDDLLQPGKAVKSLLNDIASGMQRDQFDIYFQPIVRLSDGQIVGLEALSRWNNPDRGLLLPGQFLKVTEDHPILSDLDTQTLLRACRQLQSFSQQLTTRLRMSVNVSSQLLRSQTFSQQIIDIVSTAGIEPSVLELELDEAMLLKRTQETARKLQPLTEFGVRISLDRFGSHYESLGLLQQLPLDAVKLPAAMLLAAKNRDAPNYTLMTSILAVTREMGISVIATEVETTEQIFGLEELGCGLAQGHRLVSPMPADALTQALRFRHA